MKWRTKWILAIVLTVGVIGTAKLEDKGIIEKPLTKYVRSGDDLVTVKKWIASMIDRGNEEVIPVSGEPEEQMITSYESMQPYKEGVIVSYVEPIPITAQGDGLILYTGHTRQTGKTVTVLYDNGDEVTYGFVGTFSKLPYTSVKKGDTLAVMDESAIYLKVKQGGVTLDAAAVPSYLSGLVE